MKLAGITMVRNEVDVIEFCIEHHLNQGMDYIFVCDNGSTDGTLEYLLEKSKNDDRVVLHIDNGEFHQQKIINYLSSMAFEKECEWIVPFDADEIWMSKNGIKNDLLSVQNSSVRIKLKDFIQSNSIINPDSDTYLSVNWRQPEDEERPNLEDIWSGTRSMVEIPSLYKFIVKASRDLNICAGAHAYSGQGQDFYEGEEFYAFHIPIRSYQALLIKAEQGQRLIDANYPEGHGWHVQRYAKLKQAGTLKNEWDANSEIDGVITRNNGEKKNLIFDESVSLSYKKFLNEKKKKNYSKNKNNRKKKIIKLN